MIAVVKLRLVIILASFDRSPLALATCHVTLEPTQSRHMISSLC